MATKLALPTKPFSLVDAAAIGSAAYAAPAGRADYNGHRYDVYCVINGGWACSYTYRHLR